MSDSRIVVLSILLVSAVATVPLASALALPAVPADGIDESIEGA